jgi:uncharacterized membrane protein (DUF485 family)
VAALPAEQEQKGFDWWAAPVRTAPGSALPTVPEPAGGGAATEAEPEAPEGRISDETSELPSDTKGGPEAGIEPEPESWWETEFAREPGTAPERDQEPEPAVEFVRESETGCAIGTGPAPGVPGSSSPAAAVRAHAEVYRHVQAGEEFQEIRREYRRFVFPACLVFLSWYVLYIVAAVTLPGLMDRRIAGPLNVAWLLGLLQFASTFLITLLYARHARDRRDRAALGLRWETQDRLR